MSALCQKRTHAPQQSPCSLDHVENILSGQYSHPLRVIAFNTVEGWARDVTEDIANAVLSKAQSEHRPIGKAVQEFLVRTLGVDAPLGD